MSQSSGVRFPLLLLSVLAAACGGETGSDGTTSAGGTPGSGGIAATGGTASSGGSGGAPHSGTGGAPAAGGQPGTGGSTTTECGGCSLPPVCGTPEENDRCSCGCTRVGEVERVGEGVSFVCTETGCLRMVLSRCLDNDETGTVGPVVPFCPCSVPSGDYCCADDASFSGYSCTDGNWSEGFWDYPCGGFAPDAGPPDGAVAGSILCGLE